MRFARVNELKPNMITMRALYDNNGNCMLAANKKLTLPIINRMKSNNYLGIYVYDEYSSHYDYKELFSQEKRLDTIKALRTLDYDKVSFFATEIVSSVSEKSDVLIEMQDLSHFHGDTYNHSINVALLSVPCGIGLGLDDTQLNNLATAALLHDIGKQRIPKEIIDKPGKLTAEERELMQKHPRFGYDMLYSKYELSASMRAAVLLHHENEDGTGYPLGLKGDKIPILAKIIHVADVYDAMCRKRAYKEANRASDCIEYLYGNCGTLFNSEVVKVFTKYVVIYPIGITVRLSDGRLARVIKNRQEYILRPVVIIEKSKEIIDLAYDISARSITIIDNETPELNEF